MKILLWVFIVTSFLLVGSAIIVSASGYRFSVRTSKFEKTAFIRIKTLPREADIWFDGKKVASRSPWQKGRLFPGSYDLKIQKPSYFDYSKTVNLSPSQALIAEKIVLFKKDGELTKATEEEVKTLASFKRPDDLFVHSAEIFTAEKLITRLSRDVFEATWYPNKNYVMYQVGGELHVTEIDGSNDIKLLELGSDKPTQFMVSSDDKFLIVRTAEGVKKLRLLD